MKANTKVATNTSKTLKPAEQLLSQTMVKKENFDVKDLEAKYIALNNEISGLKTNVEDLTKENDRLREKTGEAAIGPIKDAGSTKTNKESLDQISFLLTTNEELSGTLKNLKADHRNLQNNNNSEIDKVKKLTKRAADLTKELHDWDEKNIVTSDENFKLRETLKNTENTLKQKAKYLDAIAKNVDSRLIIEGLIKGDPAKRDTIKRNSVINNSSIFKNN